MLSAVKDTFSRLISTSSPEAGTRKRTLEGSAEEEEILGDGAGEPSRKRHRSLTEIEDDQNVVIKRQGSVGLKRFFGGNILQRMSSWMSSFSSTGDLSYQNGQENCVFQEPDERKAGPETGVRGIKAPDELENRGSLLDMHVKNKESMFKFSQMPPNSRNNTSAPVGQPISHLLDFPIRPRPELHPQSSINQTPHTTTHTTSTPKMGGLHNANGGQEPMSPITPVISPEFRFSPSTGTTADGKRKLPVISGKESKFSKPMKNSPSQKIPLFGKKSGSVNKSSMFKRTGLHDKFFPQTSNKSRFGSLFSRRSSAVHENFGRDKSLVSNYLESQMSWQKRIQDVTSSAEEHDPTNYRIRNAMTMIRIHSDDHKATREYYRKESVRMEEKMRYKQLLQQYNTSHSSSLLAPSFTSAESITTTPSQSRSVSPFPAIQKDVYSESWTIQKRRTLEETIRGKPSYLSTQPRLSSTQTASSKTLNASASLPLGASASIFAKSTQTKPTSKKYLKGLDSHKVDPDVIDLDENENNCEAKDSDSDSIIVTGEIKKPRSRHNLLEQRLKESPVYNMDWLKSLKEKYDSRNAAVETSAAEADKIKQQFSERREKMKRSMEQRVIRRMSLLDLTFPSKIQELEPEEEELAELTEEMENMIDDWLRGPPGQHLTEKFNIQITRRDIQTLAGLNWLNDEVINFYMNLLVERGQINSDMLSVHAFNTFFYPKLMKSGYATIKRWTKKVDVFSQDLLIVPVHLGMHWCLATIDFRDKTIRYYDSMLGDNDRCLQALLEYLNQEHQDKKKSSYSTDDWNMENVKEIPQQMNGSDCGMFACKFAEYLARDSRISFNQEHMPYFRRRMVYEIVTNSLLSP